MNTKKPRSLAAAIYAVGEPPCETLKCPHLDTCRAMKTCCTYFRGWVDTGSVPRKVRIKPMALAMSGPDMTLAQWLERAVTRASSA
jgi:hypothetical protein